MMPILRRAKDAFETSTQLKHEAEALRLIMLNGSAWRAWKAAESAGAPAGVITTLKAAAAAITTASGTDVVALPNVWPAFTGTLRTASVFDQIAAEAMPVNFWTKVGMMSTNYRQQGCGRREQARPGGGDSLKAARRPKNS